MYFTPTADVLIVRSDTLRGGCQSRVFSLCPGSQARGPVPLVSLESSAASPFGLVLPTLGAHMDADSGSLMVASSDGRDRRHVPCDAHLSKARTDTVASCSINTMHTR